MTERTAGGRLKPHTWSVWLALAGVLGAGFWLVSLRQPPAETAPDSRAQARDAPAAVARVEMSARVEEVAPSRAFWVVEEGRRLLVLPLDRDTPMDAVRPGETVALVGQLEKPASPDVIMREWGLDPRTAAILAREPVYLRAQIIRPARK